MKDESSTQSETKPAYRWDFFLAHAGPDLEIARTLKQKLDPPARVFLDADMQPGDNWYRMLPEAQRASLISVIIITPNTKKADYEQDEIITAIQLAREDPDAHRVVPVYVGPHEVTYGLGIKQSLHITGPDDFAMVRDELLETLRKMKDYEAKKTAVAVRQREALERLIGEGDTNADLLAVLSEIPRLVPLLLFSKITSFVRPLLNALLLIFVGVVVLLAVGLLLPYFEDVRALFASVFGGLAALILAAILWLVHISLKVARQIA